MAMRERGQFEYFQGRNRQWFVRERHRNGEIVMQSEGYTRKDSAKKAAERLRRQKRGRWLVEETTR